MNRLPVYRAPWWLPGGHLQTIFPVARKAPLPAYRRERWDTPDGDFIELDWVDPAGPASAAPMRIAPPQPAAPQADPAPLSVPLVIPLFILFHGLEGSSRSHYARSLMQAAAALSHHGPVAETFIADRVPYAAAMTDGRTAIELAPKGPAAIETAALWKHIKTCMHANMQKAQKVKRHA